VAVALEVDAVCLALVLRSVGRAKGQLRRSAPLSRSAAAVLVEVEPPRGPTAQRRTGTRTRGRTSLSSFHNEAGCCQRCPEVGMRNNNQETDKDPAQDIGIGIAARIHKV